MNYRKSSADVRKSLKLMPENLPRNTHSPSFADLHSEVEGWRRRTRNMGTIGRSSYRPQGG